MDESGGPDRFEYLKKMSCNEFLAFVKNKISEMMREKKRNKK